MATLFQGAFNDNAYRWIIAFYLLNRHGDEGKETIVALGAILFSVPYILFPGTAGALSDRFSKRTITVWTKAWEVMVMVMGLVAFWLDIELFMWAMLFMMNMQSAFFSPSKYGILPEMLPESRLSWGNGVMNMATFVAIIAGTGCAGLLFEWDLTIYTMSGILILLSSLGLLCSLFVTSVPPADPARRIPINPWAGLWRYLRVFYRDNILFLMLIAGSYFWFAGALVQQNIPIFVRSTLGRSEFDVSLFLAVVSIGIGAGSIVAGYVSRRKIELGLVPLGMGGMAVCALLLGLAWPTYATVLVFVFFLGFSSGFYVVPVNAMIQHRSPVENKGGAIAAFNVTNCIGILLAGGLFMGSGMAGWLDSYGFFVLTAALTAFVGLYLCWAFPVFILRLIVWVLTSTVFRLRVKGAEHVPERGGVLLVARFNSCVHALVVAASIDRPVFFPMADAVFAARGFRLAARALGIKVKQRRGRDEAPTEADHLAEARAMLEKGEVVCTFYEGQVTPTGEMALAALLEGIAAETEAPVVPVFVESLLHDLMEPVKGRLRFFLPKRLPFPIMVSYGEPLPLGARVAEVMTSMQEAGRQAYLERHWEEPLLHRAFIRWARRQPRQMALADARTASLSKFKALAGSIILGRKLRTLLGEEPVVGVLVPPSVGGALTNVALQIMGRIPVNLNYTASADTMAAAARQAGLKQVVTARAFLEKLPLNVPGEALYLEDIMASVTKRDRVVGLLMALFAPVRRIERSLGSPTGRTEHDTATIIFSSGSEGEPKGVMLTHYGILSNIDAMVKLYAYGRGHMMGILPFFHSFGFTVTLWLPLVRDVGVVYHPNPLEARAIGRLIKKHGASFFIATSTFLQNFIRRCSADEMSSLRIVMCGAEKLTSRVRDAFVSKFAVEPIEGYGVTECSPVVSCNTYDYNVPGFYRRGLKRGSIGRPIPGVCAKVVDPETHDPLPPGEDGLLLLKGPNVMKGYLNMPELTAEKVREGWYETGDIVSMDEEGFITITDRLARFSKIGGEMVPHIKVEEALHELLGLTEQSLAVASVPDPSRGERLVVLHTLEDNQLEELLGKLDKAGLPNLWRPRPNAFYRIDAIPVLGTGKMDVKAVKALARKLDIGD